MAVSDASLGAKRIEERFEPAFLASTSAGRVSWGQMTCNCDDGDATAGQSRSDRLNRGCFCRTLDPTALNEALARELGGEGLPSDLLINRPNLFSAVPVFLSAAEMVELHGVVAAIHQVASNPGYRQAALAWAPPVAQSDFGLRGALMGFDFHLTDDGPRLIEVNTNAGGAFLNALLGQAQRACCVAAGLGVEAGQAAGFGEAARQMFAQEWRYQRGAGTAHRIAIVDDAPLEQYLHPEFLLAKTTLEAGGAEVLIVDPGELVYEAGRLRVGESEIDLVYNRLVDFALEEDRHTELRRAYLDGAVVLTPNPHAHALYADKRTLVLLSDRATLEAWGVPPHALEALRAVPRTLCVTPQNADELWRGRKAWFFKPTRGHGSKGVYRGEKLTTRVWAEIIADDYVAQAYARPSERLIKIDGYLEARKVDVRLYTYDGQILLAAARLYQGQATNFRTPGGGFAPLFVA